MTLKKPYTLIIFLVICFSGCKKSGDGCPAKTGVAVAANYTSITAGWDLKLSADYNSLYKYVWSGPNGWTMQTTSAVATKSNIQMQDAGTYSVKVYNFNDCLVQEGSKAITVTAVQNPPCEASLTNNTCTSDIAGLSYIIFDAAYWGYNPASNSSSVDCYLSPPIPGTPWSSLMTLTFLGHNRPKPGLYKTIYGYNAFGEEYEVSMHLRDPATGRTYYTMYDDKVYVTLVNGKTQICFCNIMLKEQPAAGIQYFISGKFTIVN